MADLLPSTPDPSAGDDGEPRVIGVDSDDADDLLAALQSETARDLLGVLYDDPATPSTLAERADTSIQNARYHLDKLADADLVEVADTVYSEKGREMKVYAPAAKPLVVFAGNDDDTAGLETALSRLLGALGVLGLSSLAVQRIFGGGGGVGTDVEFRGGDSAAEPTEGQNASAGSERATTTESQGAGADGFDGQSVNVAADEDEVTTTTEEAAGKMVEQDAAEATSETAGRTTVEEAGATTVEEATEATRAVAETTQTATETAAGSTTTVADAAEAGGAALGALPPGLLFFAGGLVVLLALGAAWYLSAR